MNENKNQGLWREKVLAVAKGFYDRNIVDGTKEGNRIIGVEIIGGATGRPEKDYKNGKTAWCGYYVQCCYRAAGFNTGVTLASPGKAMDVFGKYRSSALPGASAFALDTRTGAIEPIKELHQRLGMLRTVSKVPGPVTPGDIVVYRADNGNSWQGHVMMAYAVSPDGKELTIIEGNSYKTIGPDGKKRDGVGTRVFRLDEPYVTGIISPSDLDFDPAYQYFSTREKAEKAWAKLAAKGPANG